ncbi:MAG TPA: PAS domain S-box protein [Polyangiales bacterium]|nr:PAS domain S-box protein [Polyangiales bacterium]
MRVAEGGEPAATDAGADSPRNAAELQSLLGAVPDPLFVLREDGCILQLSAAAQQALGPAAREGAAFAELWRAEQRPLVDSALAQADGERVLVEASAPSGTRFELRVGRGSFAGAPAYVVVARPQFGAGPDDALYRQTGAQLRELAPVYRALFDASLFGVALFDMHGRYHDLNPAFEKLIGYSRGEVLGRNNAELGVISSASMEAANAELAAGNTQLGLLEFTRHDGETRLAMHCTSPVRLPAGTFLLGIGFDITDYVRFQEALRDQDQKFRALFDNVADGIFFCRSDGSFFEVNPAACRQLGYSRAELLQMGVIQVSAREGFDVERAMRGFAETGHLTYVTSHRRRDGTTFPVELTLQRIEHAGQRAVAAITRDLTEQKRIEDDLRDARDRLHAILQALPDLLFEFDADGVICDFYSSRKGLLTDPPQTFLNKNLSDLTTPEVSGILLGAIREAVENGLSVGAQYRVRGDRWMELSAARRGDLGPDQKPRVIALAREITERKLREQELERRNDELMRFTYTVSHDLKGPLVTIKSFLGYLSQDMAAGELDKAQKDIEYMRKAADRMDELMEDLLELSRVGRKTHPPVHLSLRALAQEACELLAGRISNCNAEVILPEDDVLLWGDRVRLLEVLQNLLDNALKFSEGRPVDGRVRVWVEVARREDEYVVSVRDRGIGIDPRYQHKLFGLFEKLHSHTEGTGIGLALVKRIIEVHGGKVWAESAGEGRGTTVSFTLPNTQPGGGSA